MLVTESLWWRLFSLCWWFFSMYLINILNLSPTHFVSNVRHQHRCHLLMLRLIVLFCRPKTRYWKRIGLFDICLVIGSCGHEFRVRTLKSWKQYVLRHIKFSWWRSEKKFQNQNFICQNKYIKSFYLYDKKRSWI